MSVIKEICLKKNMNNRVPLVKSQLAPGLGPRRLSAVCAEAPYSAEQTAT